MKQQALGLIETLGLVAAIEGADAALKAAAVEFLGYTKVNGGLISIAVTGEVAAVQAAVAAGCAGAERVGRVISCHVISRPFADPELLFNQPIGSPTADSVSSSGPVVSKRKYRQGRSLVEQEGSAAATESTLTEEYLDSLTVAQLRRMARKMSGVALNGRQISKANKQQLIAELLRTNKPQ